MFKHFEPNKIFSITSKAPRYVLYLLVIVLTIGLIESLLLSPEDYLQSHTVRIIDLEPTDDGFADNLEIETQADAIMDFTEQTPFGPP